MIGNKRVVAWTPFGRETTVSLLVRYIEREVKRGIVDEYVIYMNVGDNQEGDRAYGYQLAEQHEWIRLIERPERHPGPIQRSTGYFYRYATDADTVYVRLDDDIVYLHEDAITNLVTKRLEMPHPVAVFGTTWNNAIVSYFAQAQGIIPPEWGQCTMYCMDPVGWADGAFAVKIHELLLDHIEAGTVDQMYLYQDFPIRPGTQFSVSCFASLGSMYAGLLKPGVLVPDEEEHWHTVHQPTVIGHPNVLVGNAIISHFTFMPQRPHVLATNILDRYRQLAEKIGA
jgi:hypothetical protein